MRPVLVDDNEKEHTEGGEGCRTVNVRVTPEVLNQMVILAYGHGASITFTSEDDGFVTPAITEDTEMSLVPTAEVLKGMSMVTLLRKWAAISAIPTPLDDRQALFNRTMMLVSPFDMEAHAKMASVGEEFVVPEESHE